MAEVGGGSEYVKTIRHRQNLEEEEGRQPKDEHSLVENFSQRCLQGGPGLANQQHGCTTLPTPNPVLSPQFVQLAHTNMGGFWYSRGDVPTALKCYLTSLRQRTRTVPTGVG